MYCRFLRTILLSSILVMHSACHTLTIENSAMANISDREINVIDTTSSTRYFGFVRSDTTIAESACDKNRWTKLMLTESGSSVSSIVLVNVFGGMGLAISVGMAATACGSPNPSVLCGVGLGALALGVATAGLSPILHVSAFGHTNAVTWHCEA